MQNTDRHAPWIILLLLLTLVTLVPACGGGGGGGGGGGSSADVTPDSGCGGAFGWPMASLLR